MAKKSSSFNVDSLIANEQIICSEVSEEIEDATIVYATKTIVGRALPDVRDGLKPVLRRILFASNEKGYLPHKEYVKNAKIVGDTMGEYHPHGDGSIYSAEVSMAQPWTYRYPLIDFQGNKGNIDGDGAAAMRYTEGKLHKRALSMLDDLDKECVKFKPNYSETKQEPEVLPGLFPNLLLNGSSGIAVGYTTAIPSHQLGEVVDAIIYAIKHEDCTIDDLMQHIKGPDFPCGGQLINNENIKILYETGKGTLTVRGKHKLETNEENGNTQIIITEIPPNVSKPKLVEQIYNLCFEKKSIPRVNDVRDESEGEEVRIVVELHKTGVPDIVINELYSKSALEKNSTYIMRCIVNQVPKILNLKQIIEYYIDHRRSVVELRTKFLLDKNQHRLMIQEGYNIVLKDIKKAVEIITNADNDKVAKEELMNYFGLNEEQTNQILEMKLRSLTKLNKDDILNLIKELSGSISQYENILSSTKEIDKVIVSELRDLKSKFNDERKTNIIEENEIQTSVSVQNSNDPIALVLTSKNNIKHVTLKALDDMFKNKAFRERTDVFIQGVKCQMNNTFILVLENGEYVKVEFGDLMGSMTFLPDKVKIKSIIVCDENEEKTVFAITKKGIIKKVKLSGFKARLRRVTPLFNIEDNDELVCVRVSDNSEDNIITILTKDGLIHRFFAKSFKDTAAGGKGINGISLNDDNEVVQFDVTKQSDDEKTKIIIYAKHEDGKYSMKSMAISEFKPKGRVSQGIIGIEFTKKQPGELVGMVISSEDFFTVDSKGIITTNSLELLPEFTRYNKSKEIENEIFITKFFLE